MGLIVERLLSKGQIVESDRKKLPEGVLCRVKYPICNIGEMNRNKRIYGPEVWERVGKDIDVQEKLKGRCLFGHAEHPKDTSQSSTEKISHVVTKIFNEDKTLVKCEIDVLDTPYGRICDTLLRAGCGLGTSTRAEGELEEVIEEGKESYYKVVAETYSLKTIDFTADPSTYGAYPEAVERDLVGIVKAGVDSEKIDRQYAQVVLESLKVNEAKELLEAITHDLHHKDCKCKKSEKKCGKGCKNSNEAAFGSVAWQDEQIAKIKAKLQKGEPLDGSDKAFIETQMEHNKHGEVAELEKMWKASESKTKIKEMEAGAGGGDLISNIRVVLKEIFVDKEQSIERTTGGWKITVKGVKDGNLMVTVQENVQIKEEEMSAQQVFDELKKQGETDEQAAEHTLSLVSGGIFDAAEGEQRKASIDMAVKLFTGKIKPEELIKKDEATESKKQLKEMEAGAGGGPSGVPLGDANPAADSDKKKAQEDDDKKKEKIVVIGRNTAQMEGWAGYSKEDLKEFAMIAEKNPARFSRMFSGKVPLVGAALAESVKALKALTETKEGKTVGKIKEALAGGDWKPTQTEIEFLKRKKLVFGELLAMAKKAAESDNRGTSWDMEVGDIEALLKEVSMTLAEGKTVGKIKETLDFDTVYAEMQKVSDVYLLGKEDKKAISEAKTVLDLQHKTLKIAADARKNEAIARAERDKAIEMLEAKTAEITAAELAAKAKIKELGETLLKETKAIYEKKMDEMVKAYEAKIVKAQEDAKLEIFLKTVIEAKVKASGMELPENAMVVIRQCRTEAEVDALISKFRYALKENMLHGGKPGSINLGLADSNEINPLIAETEKLVRGIR